LLKSCDGGMDSAVHCSIIEALDAGKVPIEEETA